MALATKIKQRKPETERIEGTVTSFDLEKILGTSLTSFLVLTINEENSATPKYPERLARFPFRGGIFGLFEVQNVLLNQRVKYKVTTFPGDTPTEYSLEVYSGPLKGRICKETISYNSHDMELPSDMEQRIGSSECE